MAALPLVALALLAAPDAASGQKSTVNKTITTADGVELSATLYPNPGAKRDAVVVLLNDVDPKAKGAGQQAWADLAAALQKDGFVVLTFDFRGFGDSKTVDPAKFWKSRHNAVPQFIKKGKGKDAIDHKDFSPTYLPYLVNDVAAVKAYLDRRSDARELNSSNMILIGAGQGATLGALWMAHAARNCKDKNPNPLLGGAPILADPEIKDVTACVWLTMSPSVGGKGGQALLGKILREASQKYKAPMAFVYGKTDAAGTLFSDGLLATIRSGKLKPAENTGRYQVPGTSLKGQSLLDKNLKTSDWIVNNYLKELMSNYKSREQIDRKATEHAYFYAENGKILKRAKPAGQEVGEVELDWVLERVRVGGN